MPERLLVRPAIKNFLKTEMGYRGCLSTLVFGKTVPNVKNLAKAQNVKIRSECQGDNLI